MADEFASYPVDHLGAVLDDPDGVDTAVSALVDAGADPDTVQVLCGEDGMARLDAQGERGGVAHRLARKVLAFGAEGEEIRAIESELAAGHYALVVAAADDDRRAVLAQALRDVGARRIRFFARNHVEDLSTVPPS